MIRKKLLAALAVGALALGGLSTVAPASAAEVAPTVAAVTQQADTAKRVPTCGPEDYFPNGYLYVYNSFNCDSLSFLFSMAPEGWGWTCFNMTQWGPAPNGFSNQLSSVENESGNAVGFYDGFNCAEPVLFAVNSGTQRASLVTAANNKASSFRVDNNGTWPPN